MKHFMQANYPGDVKAAEIFKRADCHLSLPELRALLAGVLMGHSFVPPAKVLEEIEFGAIDQPEFGDKELANEFMNAFFGLWNEVAKHREPNHPFTFSQPNPTWNENDVDSWLEFAEVREREMGEFLVGLGMSDTPTRADLKDIGDKDLKNYLPSLVSKNLGILEKEARKQLRQKTKDLGRLIEILRQTDQDLKVHHRAFLQKMREIEVVPE